MKISTSARRLLASAFVGAIAMSPVYAFAQDEPDEPTPRQRARQEAQERQAREEERALLRAAREAEGAARQAERAARVGAERAARAALLQDGNGIFRMRPAQVETKPQTYLGVSTRQVGPDTKLEDVPPGVGLAVSYVDEEGPAAQAGFQENDVLVKMDDQWLINASQLTVLIRMQKKGDEATFTVIRDGEEREIEVELGEKELPVMLPGAMDMAPLVMPVPPVAPVPAIRGMGPDEEGLMRRFEGLDAQRMAEVNKQIERAMAELERHMQGQDMGDLQERMEALREQLLERQLELERLPLDVNRRLQRGLWSGGRLFMNNDDVSLRMVNQDGEVTIVVQDADGETLYEGPYPDEETLADLPEEAQEIIRQAKKYLPIEGEEPAPPQPPRPRRPAADDDEDEPAPRPRTPRRESIPV